MVTRHGAGVRVVARHKVHALLPFGNIGVTMTGAPIWVRPILNRTQLVAL